MKTNSTKYYCILLCITIILLYIIYYFIGIFPDEHTECELSIHHNGIFLNSPVTLFNNWNVYTFITYPIVFIKRIFPNNNIHTYFLLFLSCVYISNYLFLFATRIKENYLQINSKISIILIPLFVIIITTLFNEIFYLQYIKVAIHLIFTGIILYNLSKNNGIRTIGFICTILGILIRYESIMIVLPFLILTYLLFFDAFNKQKIFIKVKNNLCFVIATIIAIIFCNQNYTKADKSYYPYHDIVNTIADFRLNDVNTTTKTDLDLAKLKMIQHYYYNDIKNINPKDAYRLGIKPMSRNPIKLLKYFNLKKSINRGIIDFIKFIRNNYKYIIIYLFCYMTLLILSKKHNALKHLFYLISGFIFLVAMSIYMDIQERFSLPVLSFIFIFSLFILLKDKMRYGNKSIIILNIVMIILFSLNSYNNYFKLQIYHEIDVQAKAINETLNRNKYEVVFWDFYLWNMLNNNVASNFPLYDKKRDYSIDFPFGFALDEYKNRLETKFNTKDFYNIINQSVKNKKYVYFYTEEHLATIINYINLQYKRKIIINKLSINELYFDKLINPNIKYYLFYLSED